MAPDSKVDHQHLLLIGAGPGVGAAITRPFGREGFRATLISRGDGEGRTSRRCDADRRRGGRRRRSRRERHDRQTGCAGTAFDPNNIAELFWTAHSHGPDEWLVEYRFEPTQE